MDVYIGFVEPRNRNIVGIAMCFQVGQGCGSTFFHYITQVAGQGKHAFTFAQYSFDKKDITTDISPGQSHHYARYIYTGIFIIHIHRSAQGCTYYFCFYGRSDGFPKGYIHSQVSHYPGYFTIQFAYTRLTGIALDQLLQYRIAEVQFIICQAMCFFLFRDQVLLGNLDLFLNCITTQVNDLQAIS
ncbi:hypothetical protein D9M68_755230 [compost metagenome]